MNIRYAISNFDIILVIDGKASTVGLTHPNYMEICRALQSGDHEKAVGLLDVKKRVEEVYAGKGIDAKIKETSEGDVNLIIDGHTLTGKIADVFMSYKRAGVPLKALVSFWKKFTANAKLGGEADYVRRQDLLRFLVRSKLVITPAGNFIAFKGVRRSLGGVSGPYPSQYDPAFVYYLNKAAEEPRAKHIEDVHVACGVGLHAGAIEFAKSYGDLRLAVEIDPRDVVTVPTDNDNHLRCWKLIPRRIHPNDAAPVEHFFRLDTPEKVDLEIGGSKPAKPKATRTLKPAGAKRGGGRTPKTTWYKVVGGKLIRQRKVVCPGDGWSSVLPGAQEVKRVTPKGAEVKRTYYRVIPGKPKSCNVETARASKCPPGFTGTRPAWFSNKR